MVSFSIRNIPLWRHLILFLVSTIFQFNHLLLGAEAGSMKYSHGPLVSALSARSLDYGTPTKVVAASSAVLGRDSSNAGAEAVLGSPADSGGEIVAPKTFPLSAQEPTCEQLRAMWIFSKRQSRAAEITNEIPTYRDPFAYNVWEPYYSTTRNMGGGVRMLPRYNDRSRSPVFGRVISREPIMPQRVKIGGPRQRHYNVDGINLGGASSRVYGAESKGTPSYQGGSGSSRRPSKYRHVGSNNAAANGANGGNPISVNVQGSFQRLKELIWTERARELTQQRKAEELAARAAVLREIANGQNIQSSYKHSEKSESPLMDENRSPDRDVYQHLNDDRMSIATGQARYIENNYSNKKNANTYSSNTKSNSNNDSNRRKNAKSNFRDNGRIAYSNDEDRDIEAGGAGTSSVRSLMTTNKNLNIKNDDKQKSLSPLPNRSSGSPTSIARSSSYFEDEQGIGIPRAYPMRPSHFRERNRALFREDIPVGRSSDTSFSRKTRTQLQSEMPSKNIKLLKRIIKDLNKHTYFPVIASDYFRNDIAGKDDSESDNISEEDDLNSDETSTFVLPLSATAVYDFNAGNGSETFEIKEQAVTKKKSWDELNIPEKIDIFNYVNLLLLHPSKVRKNPEDLYGYFNFY